MAGAGHVALAKLLAVAVSVALLGAAAECWTNLIDRGIDAVMPRTSGRSLPTGAVTVRSAAVLGACLSVAGFAAASALGVLPTLFLALAMFDNVVVYSALTKRSTPWSVVLGSAVGPLTLYAGYAAVKIPIASSALLAGLMVAAWVPAHIWAIGVRYRADYASASVPMAPVVWGRAHLALVSLLSGLAMGALATGAFLSLGGAAGDWLAAAVVALSVLAVLGSAVVPWRERLAGPLVKLLTAYLLFVLISLIGLAA
jgi:protoheme IX farnesyltransferase